jgi:hypothetical protein
MKHYLIYLACSIMLAPGAMADTTSQQTSLPSQVFWAGVQTLKILFEAVGSLGGSDAPGEVWIVDIRDKQRRQATQDSDLSWPVIAPDGRSVFALRGQQIVRINLATGGETAIGAPKDWRKLIGVTSDGTIVAFIADLPRARPALVQADGAVTVFEQTVSDEDRRNAANLLQENRAYAGDVTLLVKRSSRGGNGFDIFLETPREQQNLTDCGDDSCGQPSLAPDGNHVVYVRTSH